ncbi:hypothetical protein HanXRQr2_Chr12g0536121 [Helianthus annuus]|uniref:Uncharacterized protein n=1 Tax=Helianthus annuus TaxID=4232 RepID=A0A9K3HFN5_HELAN|nr:hypothetical protein HanXRQr2_Chr12g0536121 [Helianthus annuus]KAJ0492676.1 hypothetical protein HanIR_Chr12g0577541 [Helianthus annuus]KAJ0504882.1 hypothetical protein HanHA89_Chr12g0464211 [Helianthus annuus]KAJ0862288.1 hypothetical protein HanPSC8_Chr12g0516411 [Helianthus annuus]
MYCISSHVSFSSATCNTNPQEAPNKNTQTLTNNPISKPNLTLNLILAPISYSILC